MTKQEPEACDSPGKTSAKFYVSYDAALNIKTLGAEELAEVLSILPDYHEVMCLLLYWLKLVSCSSVSIATLLSVVDVVDLS